MAPKLHCQHHDQWGQQCEETKNVTKQECDGKHCERNLKCRKHAVKPREGETNLCDECFTRSDSDGDNNPEDDEENKEHGDTAVNDESEEEGEAQDGDNDNGDDESEEDDNEEESARCEAKNCEALLSSDDEGIECEYCNIANFCKKHQPKLYGPGAGEYVCNACYRDITKAGKKQGKKRKVSQSKGVKKALKSKS